MNRKETILLLLKQLKSPMDVFLRIEKLNLLRDLSFKENNVDLLKVTCKSVIDLINANMVKLQPERQRKALVILKDAHTQYGAYNFESFMIAMEWDRPIEKRFYQPRMKVLKQVMQDIQDVGDGKLDIYGLSMPPRVGKTTIGLFGIAWIAGRYPEEHIFGAGYASGLVGTFYNGVLDFVSSPEYRFLEIFPNANINKSSENKTIDLHNDGRYKTITFRSIDGQITGALEASSLLYLDDMCSGIEEAMNLDRLDKLWSKVSVDLMQRRVNNKRTGRKAPIIAIGTIWSLHDPLSKLKRHFQNDPRARFRVLPAISTDGKSNFEYDYGVGFTTDMFREMQGIMDEVSFECVYQQNPMERDGLLFPTSTLKRYLQLPNKEPDNVIAFCDVAFGSDDFLSFPIAYIYGSDMYLVDVVFRKKASYQVTEPMVVGKIISHQIKSAEFEANNGGDFYARDIIDMLKLSSTHRCNITWKTASTRIGKLARIIQYQDDIRNIYYKDPSLYKPSDDYGLFMTNLTTFVQTGSSRNDDAPDSSAGLCSLAKIPRMGSVTTRSGIRGSF